MRRLASQKPAEPTVYTLYLDSCGDSGWCPPYGKSPNRYYVVAGLALTGSTDLKAQTELEKLMIEYTGNKNELLYHDLIRGKCEFEGIEDLTRKEIADKIFDLFTELKPVLFATVVDKCRMKERYNIDAHDPKLYGMRATIGRF